MRGLVKAHKTKAEVRKIFKGKTASEINHAYDMASRHLYASRGVQHGKSLTQFGEGEPAFILTGRGWEMWVRRKRKYRSNNPVVFDIFVNGDKIDNR